jgi:copper(I)-binding protein
MKVPRCRVVFFAAALSALAPVAYAQSVKVQNAWVRATAPGQNTAAVYMDLTSGNDAALVAAGSPVAARASLHSTTIDNGVARMRPMSRLELPAGKTVKLAPNGMHLMLEDLKRPLKNGDRVPVVLSVQPSGTSLVTVNVQAEVRADAPGAMNHMH